MESHYKSNGKSKARTFFDKKSRDDYFEMLQQALINLSLVDEECEDLEVLVAE